MPWSHEVEFSICVRNHLMLTGIEGFDSEYVKMDSGASAKVEKGVANETDATLGPPSAPWGNGMRNRKV